MKENLLKLKNIIGLTAFLVLGVLTFFGNNYLFANGWIAIILVLAFLTFAYLFLFLALKGREERRGHSTIWIAIGWGATVVYVATMLCCIPFVNHFIAVNQDKTEIQKAAIDKIEAMESVNSEFYQRVEVRGEELYNGLRYHLINDDNYALRKMYPAHSGKFTYSWAKAQQKDLISYIFDNEVDKLSYIMINEQWSGNPNTISLDMKDAIERWNVFTIASTMEQLDQEIDRNMNVLSLSMALPDPYSNYHQVAYKFDIEDLSEPAKSQLKKPVYSTYFEDSESCALGQVVAWLLLILAYFPIIFVPLNRVRKGNKRFANIYDEGFSVSELK